MTEVKSETIVDEYRGKGYGDFKSDLADAEVIDHLKPVQDRYARIDAGDRSYAGAGNEGEWGRDAAQKRAYEVLKELTLKELRFSSIDSKSCRKCKGKKDARAI